MPYNSISELPDRVKKFSPKVQRQWMNVWNSIHKRLLSQGISSKNAEARAFMAANSILKKRFKEGQNLHKESHSDYMQNLIGQFLGDLNG